MTYVSVVLPTYSGDEPEALAEALDSIISQTRTPDELLIVRDGSVPEVNQSIINNYLSEYSFLQMTPFEQNRGRALARKVGVEESDGDYVAMIDADDICLPSRLERQESYLAKNTDVDIVGSQLLEFDPENQEKMRFRDLPTDHEEIYELAKRRAPISQSTAMFRRKSVLNAGNYRNVTRMEDYGLWVRMLLNGATFHNIPEVLVKARTGDDMYNRRGGLEYASEEIRLQRDFRRWGFISRKRMLMNLLTRVPLRLAPNKLRASVYESLFRTTELPPNLEAADNENIMDTKYQKKRDSES